MRFLAVNILTARLFPLSLHLIKKHKRHEILESSLQPCRLRWPETFGTLHAHHQGIATIPTFIYCSAHHSHNILVKGGIRQG